ncbi:hypothetical protein C4J81_03045 [Deltaproteobacteria bacterium Smac51]|nr:hypothetical protein C4J81_03045 [Deltaproteobacteria bacterium Smac51]
MADSKQLELNNLLPANIQFYRDRSNYVVKYLLSKETLSGLFNVPINLAALPEAVKLNSGPATVEEPQKRFGAYISQLIRGEYPSKVRIVLE